MNDGQQHRIEIVHESLLTKWPRLVHWQTQDTEGAQVRDELRQAAQTWDQHDRSDDLLWSGTALREFQLWRERYGGGLTELEDAFAAAMTARAHRRRRRRMIAVSTFITVAIIVSISTTFLWRRAAQASRRATAAKVLALGELELDSYPTAALAYATTSLETFDSAEARRFAVKALWRGPTAFVLPLPPGPWFQIAASSDGKWLAASWENVLLFPSSGAPPIVISGNDVTGAQRHTEFGPNNDWVVTNTTADDPQWLRVWSIPGGKLLGRKQLHVSAARQRMGHVWAIGGWHSAPTLYRWMFPHDQVEKTALGKVESWDIDSSARLFAFSRGPEVLIRSLVGASPERLVGTHSARVSVIKFGSGHTFLSRDQRGEIRVWSIEKDTVRLIRNIRGSESEFCLRFDLDDQRIATADPNDHVIRIRNVRDAAEVQPVELRREHSGRIEDLAFTRRSHAWLASDNLTSISLWPLANEYPRVFHGHTRTIRGIAFAPDGSWIASGSLDGTVRKWPLIESAGTSQVLVDVSGEAVYGMSVDPTGKQVVVGPTGGMNVLVSANGGQPVALEETVGAPCGTAFDRDGRRVAIGRTWTVRAEERILRIWDVRTRAVIRDLDLLNGRRNVSSGYDGGVTDLAFAPDGALYSAGDGGVRRWDIEHGTSRTVIAGKSTRMALSRDGRHVLTAEFARKDTPPSEVRYHDLTTGKSHTLDSHGSDVLSVALDLTGTIVVTGSSDGTIRVGRATGAEPHLLYGHAGGVTCLAVSPDGRWIASGGLDGTVRVWPMPDLSQPPLHTLPREKLIAKLKSLTNLRVVDDATSLNGYKVEVGTFPGWEKPVRW